MRLIPWPLSNVLLQPLLVTPATQSPQQRSFQQPTSVLEAQKPSWGLELQRHSHADHLGDRSDIVNPQHGSTLGNG